MPDGEITVVDKKTGKFASRNTLAPPRGSGYDYILGYDFAAEAAKAAEQAREKLKAKPVVPGDYDLVLHPNNLWLTIHTSQSGIRRSLIARWAGRPISPARLFAHPTSSANSSMAAS